MIQVTDSIPWVRCASGNVYLYLYLDVDLYLNLQLSSTTHLYRAHSLRSLWPHYLATQAQPARKCSFLPLPALANLQKMPTQNNLEKLCPVEYASSFDQPQGKADTDTRQVKLKCICAISAQKSDFHAAADQSKSSICIFFTSNYWNDCISTMFSLDIFLIMLYFLLPDPILWSKLWFSFRNKPLFGIWWLIFFCAKRVQQGYILVFWNWPMLTVCELDSLLSVSWELEQLFPLAAKLETAVKSKSPPNKRNPLNGKKDKIQV